MFEINLYLNMLVKKKKAKFWTSQFSFVNELLFEANS